MMGELWKEIVFDLVPAHEIAADVSHNLQRHYDELEEDDLYGPFNLDWDYYYTASMSGNCVAVTARHNGALVGYSTFTISNNANHKQIIVADNIGVYVGKPYRGRVSLALFGEVNRRLKEYGVHEINYILKDERLGKILSKQGYKPQQVIWSLRHG